jgi:endo-1,4-beta-xylanase
MKKQFWRKQIDFGFGHAFQNRRSEVENRKFRIVALTLAMMTGHACAQPSLKEVFKDYFLMGAALNENQFTGQDTRGAALVRQHFNSITPENALKWGLVHPQPDQYDFGRADRFVEFGEKNGMFSIGHTLVWHSQTPGWVFEENGKPANRDTLLGRMSNHIATDSRPIQGPDKWLGRRQ